jgi:hypothetical protein
VWGFPWVPAVFVVASATIVVNRLIADPIDSLAGLALVGLGVPAYYAWRYATGRFIIPASLGQRGLSRKTLP